jgi:hypothetical protein
VEGNNPTGKLLVANRVYEGSMLPRWHQLPENSEIFQEHRALQSQGVQVWVASGPFSLSENLEFEPLEELFQLVQKEKPDVLILVLFEFLNPNPNPNPGWTLFGRPTRVVDAV